MSQLCSLSNPREIMCNLGFWAIQIHFISFGLIWFELMYMCSLAERGQIQMYCWHRKALNSHLYDVNFLLISVLTGNCINTLRFRRYSSPGGDPEQMNICRWVQIRICDWPDRQCNSFFFFFIIFINKSLVYILTPGHWNTSFSDSAGVTRYIFDTILSWIGEATAKIWQK